MMIAYSNPSRTMNVCQTARSALPAAPRPIPFGLSARLHAGTNARNSRRIRSFEPEFSDKDGPGVASLLERDRKAVDLTDDAFAAFADQPPDTKKETTTSKPDQDIAERQQQQRERLRGPGGRRADKLREASDTPKRAREAIDLGLQKFQQRDYQAAVDLFQLALELPGSGVMRMSGSVREYSCASEGEENAALYNMACAWAALGQKQSALTVLEALLENNFDDYSAIRSDPDLASLRGPELDGLLAKYDGLLAKLFGGKKQQASSNKPWLQW